MPEGFREAVEAAGAQTVEAPAKFADVLDQHLPPLSTYLIRLHGPSPTSSYGSASTSAASGELSLLPAGWRHKERFQAYGQAVQSFDWEDFYRSYQGKEYFDWLCKKLLEAADVILIDSRTGVTEMGGVCARQMADVVVAFCASNYQNINGVSRMVQSFKRPETMKARDNRELDTLIVPTRVDSSDQTELLRFLERFQNAVDEPKNSPPEFTEVGSKFWDLRIPYKAAFSYRENLVVGPLGTRSHQRTRERLLEDCFSPGTPGAGNPPHSSKVRAPPATRLPCLLPGVVLSYMPEVRNAALAVRANIQNSGIKLWPDLDHLRSKSEDPSQWTSVISQTKHAIFVVPDFGLPR